MNFSDAQRTGLASELSIAGLFTTWGWTVGQDKIDVGYDLFVEPDQIRFGGNRFLVQIKGTVSKSSRSHVARVSKSRLRQYARCALPVFIVRALPDGSALWIHAQNWCSANRGRLDGDGDAGIAFDRTQRLHDREEFERHLEHCFLEARSLKQSVRDREVYLSGLDDRFLVDVEVRGGREGYHVRPRPGGTRAMGVLQLVTPEAKRELVQAKLQEHHDFGAPIEVEVSGIRHDSPLFKELGTADAPGVIRIHSTFQKRARISLQAGEKFDFLAPRISSDGMLHAGTVGATLAPLAHDGAIDISSRLGRNGSESEITISLNGENLSKRPLRSFRELDGVLEWASAALDCGAIYAEVELLERGGGFAKASVRDIAKLVDMLRWFQIAGRLGQVCRFLQSDFVLVLPFDLSQKESWAITTANSILRGERLAVAIRSLKIDDGAQLGSAVPGAFIVLTTLEVAVAGTLVGLLPIAVELSGYESVMGQDGQLVELNSSEHSRAWVRFYGGEDIRPEDFMGLDHASNT